jgi:hypothetical protein
MTSHFERKISVPLNLSSVSFFDSLKQERTPVSPPEFESSVS